MVGRVGVGLADSNRMTFRFGLPPIATFVVARIARMAGVLIAVWTFAFLIVRLVPGDPARAIAGLQASPGAVEELRRQLGLDQPIWEQFVTETGQLLRGNLRVSFSTQQPVSSIIAQRLPVSAELAVFAFALVLVFGVGLGLLAGIATDRGRRPAVDLTFSGFTSVLGAIPDFVSGTLLAFVFALTLGLLPVAGVDNGLASFVLPAIAVAATPTALLARVVRAETRRVLAQDYIMTARSKRLPPLIIYWRHVLPNVLTAALTIGGLIFAGLVGGTIVIENLFALPGLGSELVSAVEAHDYPVIQGSVLLLAVVVVVVNALIDLMLAALDPRLKVAS